MLRYLLAAGGLSLVSSAIAQEKSTIARDPLYCLSEAVTGFHPQDKSNIYSPARFKDLKLVVRFNHLKQGAVILENGSSFEFDCRVAEVKGASSVKLHMCHSIQGVMFNYSADKNKFIYSRGLGDLPFEKGDLPFEKGERAGSIFIAYGNCVNF